MSSLAGALDEPVRYNHHSFSALSAVAHEHDVDMETPEIKEEPHLITGQAVMHRDGEDEAMDDLFGQEVEVDEPRQVKSETCVFVSVMRSLVLILCVYSSLAPTPAESGYDSDDLSQSEKERRRTLEYPENDEPAAVVPGDQEANVSIPNIPIPRTSDGDVKCFPPLYCMTLITILALGNSCT